MLREAKKGRRDRDWREALQKLGWTDGRNIQIDTRWATPDDAESMRRLAKELVAPQPNGILSSTTATTTALLQQTRTIPIVFAIVADPIGSGFVACFARPGGNVTGFIFTEPTMAGKWLELLKEVAPGVARVAILFNPASTTYAEFTDANRAWRQAGRRQRRDSHHHIGCTCWQAHFSRPG